jgi:hypothetical protein
VVDVLVGWTYVLIATVVIGYVERRRARRAGPAAIGAAEAPPGDADYAVSESGSRPSG